MHTFVLPLAEVLAYYWVTKPGRNRTFIPGARRPWNPGKGKPSQPLATPVPCPLDDGLGNCTHDKTTVTLTNRSRKATPTLVLVVL